MLAERVATDNAQAELLALALALGARDVQGWSPEEEALTRDLLCAPTGGAIAVARRAIDGGEDPLGEWFSRLYSAEQRRVLGATYTPGAIVAAMLDWAAGELTPSRVIDPGTGSARFLVAAARRFPAATLLGIELDPVAAILARGHLAAAGFASRAVVRVRDYRAEAPPSIDGRTLYLGNPPYVRHHLLGSQWKGWLVRTARKHGLTASQLAGLHAHFFLATADYGRPGDVGALITAAEWLDVNYGRLVRELLTGVLGAKMIRVIEPRAYPFAGTAATGVITGFQIGTRPATIDLGRVASPDDLGAGTTVRAIRRECLEAAPRWTPLTRPLVERREGFVELGELCRVHRGQVTGANRVWIAGSQAADLPASVLFPAVTRARELFAAGASLDNSAVLRRVIDLPVDLSGYDVSDRERIERFLTWAKSVGADRGFIARYRKAWWSVGLRQPAPILATYMARRPPRFVRNLADARHINIAHGLYPRETMGEQSLTALASYLSRSVTMGEGRTYAGGLTKFEPREMERLLVPRPELLTDAAFIETQT